MIWLEWVSSRATKRFWMWGKVSSMARHQAEVWQIVPEGWFSTKASHCGHWEAVMRRARVGQELELGEFPLGAIRFGLG
ncbi:MAG: hypothetical protein RI897_2821 [Verrucomicrobiota bacterium]